MIGIPEPEAAIAGWDSLAAESAQAYRQRQHVEDIADRLDGRDAASLRTMADYLRASARLPPASRATP